MSETAVLTKKDLTQALSRYVMARQICFNYETMQSGGWVWSIHPAMKKIYGDDDILCEKYKSYFKFFNTNPWFGNLILMACLAVESTKDEHATETAVDIRTGLMGPLAGLGDAIVWVLLPTVMGAIAGYQAMQGSIFGWVLAEAVGVGMWLLFWKMSFVVYKQGITFITSKSSSLKNLTDVCSILGLIVIGAMIASTVHVDFTLSWTVGKLTQKLGDLLNTIIPCFGNVLFTALIYWGLGIKKMTSGKMVWIVLIVSILLGAAGICS